MKNSICKIKIFMLICSLFLLCGCGQEELAEEDLVDGREAVGEQRAEEVEAGNFPLFWDGEGERHFFTLPELEEEVKELLGDNYWPEFIGGGTGKADRNHGRYVCGFSGRAADA